MKNLSMPTEERKVSSNIGLKADNSKDIAFDNKIVVQKCNAFFFNIAPKLVENFLKKSLK